MKSTLADQMRTLIDDSVEAKRAKYADKFNAELAGVLANIKEQASHGSDWTSYDVNYGRGVLLFDEASSVVSEWLSDYLHGEGFNVKIDTPYGFGRSDKGYTLRISWRTE